VLANKLHHFEPKEQTGHRQPLHCKVLMAITWPKKAPLASGACRKKRNRKDRPTALISDEYHQTRIVIAAALLKLPNKVTGVIERSLVTAGDLYGAGRLAFLFGKDTSPPGKTTTPGLLSDGNDGARFNT
jgi:hypothetical protein